MFVVVFIYYETKRNEEKRKKKEKNFFSSLLTTFLFISNSFNIAVPDIEQMKIILKKNSTSLL